MTGRKDVEKRAGSVNLYVSTLTLGEGRSASLAFLDGEGVTSSSSARPFPSPSSSWERFFGVTRSIFSSYTFEFSYKTRSSARVVAVE